MTSIWYINLLTKYTIIFREVKGNIKLPKVFPWWLRERNCISWTETGLFTFQANVDSLIQWRKARGKVIIISTYLDFSSLDLLYAVLSKTMAVILILLPSLYKSEGTPGGHRLSLLDFSF